MINKLLQYLCKHDEKYMTTLWYKDRDDIKECLKCGKIFDINNKESK